MTIIVYSMVTGRAHTPHPSTRREVEEAYRLAKPVAGHTSRLEALGQAAARYYTVMKTKGSVMTKSLEGSAINPGVGLGPARFGMTVRHVEAILGRARLSEFDDSPFERKVNLNFHPGVWLCFYQSNDFRLSTIEVDEACLCRLFGEPLFPRTLKGLLDLLRRNLSEEEIDELEQSFDKTLNEISVILPSSGLTFYFDLDEELGCIELAEFVE